METPINDSTWVSGLDSINFNLGQGYYQWAQNTTNRGGIIGTRQGLAQLSGRQGDDETPRGLTFFAPWEVGINPVMVAAIGKYVYAVQWPYTDALDDSHRIPNILFPTSTRSVHFETCVQSQKNTNGSVAQITPRFVLIMQDGITPPAYYYLDFATGQFVSGHVVPSATPEDNPPWNVPIGSYMKWVGDRLWVATANNLHAGDLLNPLQFEEEKVLASGGFFFLPGNVTGMGFTHDYKSLLVGTDQTVSAFQVGIEDRELWPNVQDFQTVLFPNIGIVSHRTIVNQYGMTWWMSHDGVVALDSSLQAYQTSRMQVRDHNMSRSKEGINWSNGGGAAGSFGNWLFFSVPSGSKDNQHTWVMDQTVIENLNTISPPAWCANWTGVRPEQWVTTTINGEQRCFCISRDLVPSGHQATVWEAFIGQRMDVPKDGVAIDSPRKAKDIACAFETRYQGLSPVQYMYFCYAELDLAEIIGNVNLQVYYCGRRTSYKKILDKKITAFVGLTTEEVFDPDSLINVYVPQYRVVRTVSGGHDPDDNDTGIQTPYLRFLDKEFSLLVTWTGQMSITGLRMFVEPRPDYATGVCEEDELTLRGITAEGSGIITTQTPPPNAFSFAINSKYLSPLRARWVEFPSFDSATPNGVFFVDIPSFDPPAAAYPLTDYSPFKAITISTETIGSNIVYTTDGTTPSDSNGIAYTAPVQLTSVPVTLKAIALRDGLIPSAVESGQYTEAVVATPIFRPTEGRYPPASYPLSVGISCSTPSATVRYTTNGAPVTTSSPIYSTPLSIPNNTQLRAKAFNTAYLPSVEKVGNYSAQATCAAPTFVPSGGVFMTFPQSITINSVTSGSQIKYTLNNPDVINNGTIIANNGVVSVTSGDVLRAFAFKSGLVNSATTTVTYSDQQGTAATPTLSPDGGSFQQSVIPVRFNCTTAGATMVYTINSGSPPADPNRNQQNNRITSGGTISITLGHQFIKVLAFRDDMLDSPIHQAEFDRDRGGGR